MVVIDSRMEIVLICDICRSNIKSVARGSKEDVEKCVEVVVLHINRFGKWKTLIT